MLNFYDNSMPDLALKAKEQSLLKESGFENFTPVTGSGACRYGLSVGGGFAAVRIAYSMSGMVAAPQKSGSRSSLTQL